MVVGLLEVGCNTFQSDIMVVCCCFLLKLMWIFESGCITEKENITNMTNKKFRKRINSVI